MPHGNERRVALFVPNFGGGGAERVMIKLAGEFAKSGNAVDLLTADAQGPYRGEISARVRVVDFATGRVAKALPKLCGYLRRERPEILMATLTHASIIALIAKTMSGVDVRVFVREANVLSMRSAGDPLRSRVLPLLVRAFYRLADGVVAPSEGVAQDLVARHRVPPQNVRVIYNPVVDEELFMLARQEPSHPWADQTHPPLILAVGRLSAQKDFATLIRAFRRVRDRRPARLLILGEGELRGELERLIAQLGLTHDVALPGFIENPFAIMARASLFVLSSAFEGLPNAMIQAFALGTPVVATDCPSGPREILEHGRHGTLVPVGDSERMAAAMLERLDARRGAALPGAAARFHVDKVTTDYLAMFGNAQV